jgi:hypothetical protein
MPQASQGTTRQRVDMIVAPARKDERINGSRDGAKKEMAFSGLAKTRDAICKAGVEILHIEHAREVARTRARGKWWMRTLLLARNGPGPMSDLSPVFGDKAEVGLRGRQVSFWTRSGTSGRLD